MGFLNELLNRWDQDSPIFFKRLQKIGTFLYSTGLSIVGIPASLKALDLATPDLTVYAIIGGFLVTVGATMKGVAGATVVDTKTLDK